METIQRTPTYASGNIGLLPVSFIVDTGAGVSLMSKTLQERLKFRIDRAAKTAVVAANNTKAVTLGIADDVTVQFSQCQISIDMIITQSASFDIILGMDWLTKAGAVVDLGFAEMTIEKHGQKFIIPLDVTHGIRKETAIRMIDDFGEGHEEELVNIVHAKKTNDISDQ